MKTISLIAAMDRNRGIGYQGAIPWHLPADFARFKRITTGHPVIMGRKTHESIGRPLPGRRNIVITRQHGYAAEGCEVADSLESALALAGEGEAFVIGGASVYADALPLADRMYLTFVDIDVPADTRFPEFDRNLWQEIEREPGVQDEKNPYPFEFVTFEKRS